MSGKSKEQVDVSKLIDSLQKINPNLEIHQEEKYTQGTMSGHNLEIITYIVDKRTRERAELSRHKYKIPKDVPKWITKNNLWYHTNGELKQLDQLRKSKKERKPSKETLKQWKELINLDKKKEKNVLLSNNTEKPKEETYK